MDDSMDLRLARMGVQAIRVIRELMESGTPAIRRRAAKVVAGYARRGIDLDDLRARLERLEQQHAREH